jgi:hypothetical protein
MGVRVRIAGPMVKNFVRNLDFELNAVRSRFIQTH